MYTEIYLRLEPLGVELVAAAARQAGHQVRILDLQVFSHADYFKTLKDWAPDVVSFGVNYLANIPEVIDLAKETRRRLPEVLFVVGGHSASFTAAEILDARRRGDRLRHSRGGRGDRSRGCWKRGAIRRR